MPPRRLDDATRAAIERAAAEHGIDPSAALAIAERESRFDPRARSSKTIRGMYQMRGDHRSKYGIGDSDDPYAQANGWGAFFKDVKREMAGQLGRDPTDAEGYLGHHFGGVRAGRMMKMDPATPVDQVFTPREMAENPHFAKAGTVGALNDTILADIGKRSAKFGGQPAPWAEAGPVHDFSAFGSPVEAPYELGGKTNMASQAPDFTASSDGANLNMGSAAAASSAPDFSNFGAPA